MFEFESKLDNNIETKHMNNKVTEEKIFLPIQNPENEELVKVYTVWELANAVNVLWKKLQKVESKNRQMDHSGRMMDALYTKRLEEIDSLKIQNCITKGSGLIEKLQKASIENDEDFFNIIYEGICTGTFSGIELSNEFGISLPTITNWINKKNAPYPLMRQPIYNWIHNKLENL